jgi:hypothetical protein
VHSSSVQPADGNDCDKSGPSWAAKKVSVMITKTFAAAAVAIVLSVASGVAIAQTATQPAAATPATSTVAPAVTAPATAAKQVDPAVEKFRAACKADIAKLCADVIAAAKAATPVGTEPGKGTRGVMAACMTTNEAKLSGECKTAWDERKATMKAKQG